MGYRPNQAASESGVVSGTGVDKQIAEFKNKLMKKDQELVKLRDKDIKIKQEQRDQTAKFSETEKKYNDEKAKVGKYLKEKDDALKSLMAARQQADTERYNKERYKEDFQKLLEEKQGTGAGGMSYSDM